MSYISKHFDGPLSDKVKAAAIGAVIAFLKELGVVALAELAAGIEEYRKEQKTPDGWTKEEYLSYAIGRLKVIEAQEIGPWFIDNLLDYGIAWLIDELEEKLVPPVIEPPVVDPAFPPYDYLWPQIPPPEKDWYSVNSVLWRKAITDPLGVSVFEYRVTKGEIGYPGEEKIARFKLNPSRWEYLPYRP